MFSPAPIFSCGTCPTSLLEPKPAPRRSWESDVSKLQYDHTLEFRKTETDLGGGTFHLYVGPGRRDPGGWGGTRQVAADTPSVPPRDSPPTADRRGPSCAFCGSDCIPQKCLPWVTSAKCLILFKPRPNLLDSSAQALWHWAIISSIL